MGNRKQWSTKHRPKTVDGMVTESDLSNVENLARQSQALLITGATGTGKTTLARIIHNIVNGEDDQYHIKEINAADERGIDAIRTIKSELSFKPEKGKMWVVIFDEVQEMTAQASSSMLKLLEDPPSTDVLIILCTDQPWRLKRTVLNRCRPIEIKPPSKKDLAKYLIRILKKEKVKVKQKEAKKVALSIADWSGGVPRQALQLLQNAASMINKGKDWTKVKQTIGIDEDSDVNSVVGSMLLAIYSKNKSPEQRSAFIVKKMSEVDAFGVINRLSSANYYGMQLQMEGKFDWRSKLFTAPMQSAKITPSLADLLTVQRELNDIQEKLKDIRVEPTISIGTGLASIPFLLGSKKKKK